MKMPFTKSLAWGAFLALLGAAPAHALQRIEVKPDGTATARVALKETTRIKVEGAPILDVLGSVYSPDNPAGELNVAPDAAGGELYVMPGAAAVPGKPINIFVKTERATYTLLLLPMDIPSDTLLLVDRVSAAQASASSVGPRGAADWPRRLKNLLLAMTADAPMPGVMSQDINKPVRLWREARFMELRRVTLEGLVGSIYDLTNVSAAPMVLDAREFYDDGVAGVAVAVNHLAPNESTRVYVIREAGRD
jgi:conjugal transfer pilus assembly protein TraK